MTPDQSAALKQLNEHERAVRVDLASAKVAGAERIKITLSELLLDRAMGYARAAILNEKESL